MLIHRKPEKLPLGSTPRCARNPRIQEPNDGPQHVIRSAGIAAMQPENSPAETQHYSSIGVGDNPINISEPKLIEPAWQAVFEQK
jgi:hypothetical protein